jgi:putative membrane protein
VQTLAIILAALAAGVHVFIFYLESIAWESPQARATFGITSDAEARHTKPLAFNQGFYNLFLAIVTVIGIVWVVAGENAAPGHALVLAGTGSMLAAALVLFLSAPDKRPAALKQGTLPLLAVVLLGVGLALA